MHTRCKEGLRIFKLYRLGVETISHMLINCTSTRQIWKEVKKIICLANVWLGKLIEDYLRKLFPKKELKEYINIPCMVSWRIWLARNYQIFDEKFLPPFHISTQNIFMISFCKMKYSKGEPI
jgi:hypothetical protein